MQTRVKNSLIVACVALVLVAGLAYAKRQAISDLLFAATQPPLPPAVSFQQVGTDNAAAPPQPAGAPRTGAGIASSPGGPSAASSVPATFNLAVAFTTQTPLGNWDTVHEDTCEEAAVFMVDAFYRGVTSFDPNATDQTLLKIVDWENKNFGFYQDTTAAQTATIAEKYFGYKVAKVETNPTVDSIKREVLAGHPVIVPANGQELGNPYFTPPGPIYHMIVIRGWTKAGFITNDPGTKHGNGYVYSESVVMNAMHDWDPATKKADGAKVVLVVYPN